MSLAWLVTSAILGAKRSRYDSPVLCDESVIEKPEGLTLVGLTCHFSAYILCLSALD